MSESLLTRLDNIVGLVTDKVVGQKDKSKPYIGLEHLPSSGTSIIGIGRAEDSISTNNVFRSGDILFGKLRPQLRKCVQVDFEGYCSTDILVLRPLEAHCSTYAAKLCQSEAVFVEAIGSEEGTKMPRTSWQSIRQVEIFTPELSKQQRIAKILTTLDNLIEKTEVLIAKYQAVKQGMMYDLFTRGVDEHGHLRPPHAEAPHLYKPSPLGWIPREWQCSQVHDHIARIEQGWSPDCDSESAKEGEWGVLKTTAVVWDGFDGRENKRLPKNLVPAREYEVRVSDVLMTRGGPNSRVGVVAYVEHVQKKLMLSDKIYRIIPLASVLSRFLALALSSTWTQANLSTQKTGLAESQTNISQEILRRLWIGLPGRDEQHLIAERYSALSGRLNSEKQLLEKYSLIKFGVMHDLLTGKVRVHVDPAEEAAHA